MVVANPRSEAAHFGLAWLAWQRRDTAVRRQLDAVRVAPEPEWKPKRATAEGDTKRLFHEGGSLLKPAADTWDGDAVPEPTFAELRRRWGAMVGGAGEAAR